MFPLAKLGVPLAVTMLLVTVGVSGQDCNTSQSGFTLPCNKKLDPWRSMREKVDGLTAEVDDASQEGDMWTSVLQKMKKTSWGDQATSLAETVEKQKEKMAEKAKEAADKATETAEAVAEKAKKSKAWMQKGLKVLGAIATAAQFVGPILDIILLFVPASKSAELQAIESGFAKMGAKIDAVSYNLDSIKGAADWNAFVSQLMEFEGDVNHMTKKYKELVEEINAADPDEELTAIIKSHIEDLVNDVRTSGKIGSKLELVKSLFQGTSAFSKGKTLLEMFVDAVDNDCSKILPMSHKLLSVVKNAQRLQFFYEINQKLVEPNDDKGYPKAVYDMYKQSLLAYTKCTRAAASNARQDMKVLYGDGESLLTIINKMESKYDLYNWMTIKENDKEDEVYAFIDNFATNMTVELTGLTDDEKEEQRLALFSVAKASSTEVKDAIARVERVLAGLEKSDLPLIGSSDNWDDSQSFRNDILREVRDLLKRDDVLKIMVEKGRISMVMFEEDSSIELTGWHFVSTMEVLDADVFEKYSPDILKFKLGLAFSFNSGTEDFKCPDGSGNIIDLSFEGSFPYCLCNMGYGGASCEISIADGASSMSNSVLKMVQTYKVPGMFDLQSEIREGTNTILRQMENNKQEIFAVAKQTSRDVKKTENAILSAQSIMLNQLKADNAKVLNGLSGIQEAMEAAFEKTRNEMIYRTEEGHKVVVQTINEANKKVIDSISKLTGKVIENRYFKDLKLHFPIFQRKFQTAMSPIMEEMSPMMEEQFSQYLDSHELELQAVKEAAKKAMVEKSDSYVVGRMQIAMTSGCTAEYTKEIKSTWAELMEIHLGMTTMETWNLEYKIKKSQSEKYRKFYRLLERQLEKKTVAETDEFKAAYNTQGCPGFTNPDLIGGGCAASTTFAGQTVSLTCSDSDKSLVLITSGEGVSNVYCDQDGWAMRINELRCVKKCKHVDNLYAVGETMKLPEPPKGFYYADKDGNTITEATCLVTKDTCIQQSDPKGLLYRGTVSVTKSGYKCQRWDSKTPTNHRYNYDDPKYAGLGLLENYCRNPDGGREPWCYNAEYNGEDTTVVPRWEYCNIHRCAQTDDCIQDDDPKGENYRGTLSHTKSGLKCQIWDSQSPNKHGFYQKKFADKGLDNNNYCRNPDGGKQPWCYNGEGKVPRWEYCEVPKCHKRDDCLIEGDDKGALYRGRQALTEDGRQCQRWDSHYPNKHSNLTPEKYPQGGLDENYCRNPSGNANEPWCYNGEGTSPRWQPCRIPKCAERGGFHPIWSQTQTLDINECATPDFCRHGGTCVNTPGSFTCTCKDGFTLDGDGKCEDVNECSHGNVGYQKCLVQQQLGTCQNTQGSYTCGCLAGSYTTPSQGGKECLACNCNSNGVTSAVCDGKTGACLCNANVGGDDCRHCNTGYTNYPYCTQCAAGYYGYPNCAKCSCSDSGVTARICDPNSGTCECKPYVGGTKCDRCQPTYADNCVKTGTNGADYRGNIAVTVSGRRCQNWDSQSPNKHSRTPAKHKNSGLTANSCRNPDGEPGPWCYNSEGTKPRYELCAIPACPATGVLNCVKDVRDGTLSSWGAWSSWVDQGECGPSYKKGFYQKRTRTRSCDDSTRNIHGRSCGGDKTEDVQTRFRDVCRKITEVAITLYTSFHSGTTADLQMWIKQGNIEECGTKDPTWEAPTESSSYEKTFWKDDTSCSKTFDYTKPVDLWLTSDSDNDVYITKMAVYFGDVDVVKEWRIVDDDNFDGNYVAITEDYGRQWYTTTHTR